MKGTCLFAAALALALAAGCASDPYRKAPPPPVVYEPRPPPVTLPPVLVVPVEPPAPFPAVDDRVSLAVDRERLRIGSRAHLVITVTRLGGLAAPAEIRVINETPGVIRLEGGNDQRIAIDAGRVDAVGAFTARIPFTVLRRGEYSVRVLGPARRVL